MNLILCDDVLTVRANKTKTVKVNDHYRNYEIGLRADYKSYCKIAMEKGKAVILGYMLPNGDYVSKNKSDDDDYMFEKYQNNWYVFAKAVYRYEYKTGRECDKIFIESNQIDIRLHKLSDPQGTDPDRILMNRYGYLNRLHFVCGLDLFDYAGKDVERNKQETFRLRLKRRFWVAKYEYNIVIKNKELGLAVYNELKEMFESGKYPEMHIEGDVDKTIYLQGYQKGSTRRMIKMYDMGYHNSSLKGIYKIEITFKTKDFTEKKIGISDLTSQENMLECFLPDVLIELDRWGKRGVMMSRIQSLFYSEKENILARIIRLEQKDIVIDKRFDKLEKMIKELQKNKIDEKIPNGVL